MYSTQCIENTDFNSISLSADMGSLICRGLIDSAQPGAITRCRAAVCQSDACNNYNFRSDPSLVSSCTIHIIDLRIVFIYTV